MTLTPEEREELTNIYAELHRGGEGWSPTPEEQREGRERLHEATWAALCHATGRCGLHVPGRYPGTPQARLYELLSKALR